MFTNVYLPMTNGVVTSVRSFRQGLVSRGHVVYVLAPHATEPYQRDERFVFRYPALELPLQRYPLTLPVSPFMDMLLPCLAPDVLHAHHPVMLGRVAAKKSRSLGVPLVFTYHTRYQEYSHYAKAMPEHLVKEFLENWLANFMRKCHHVIVPSESIRDMLEDTYGITKRVSVVATGVDRAVFQCSDRQLAREEMGWDEGHTVLVSVGRLAREKNWELLFEAFQKALHRHPSARLLVIGGGEEQERLQSFCAGLAIEGQVTFTGSVPFAVIPRYLCAADLFCFASVTETQGLVTLEAMASGLPVVAVDASGTRDVLTDGREGFLTDLDSRALADKLCLLITDPDLRKRFAQAASRRAADFDIAAQAARLEDVYHIAIEDYRSGYRVPVQADHSTSGFRRFFSYFNRA
jgi:glycosyltransferase involved in cell wall biosynthesis